MKYAVLLFALIISFSCKEEMITGQSDHPEFPTPTTLKSKSNERLLTLSTYHEDFAYSGANYPEVSIQHETTPFDYGYYWLDLNGQEVPWYVNESQIYKLSPWYIENYDDIQFQLHVKTSANMGFIFPIYNPTLGQQKVTKLAYRVVSAYNAYHTIKYNVYLYYNGAWHNFKSNLTVTSSQYVVFSLPKAAQNGTAVAFSVTQNQQFDDGIRISEMTLY